MHQFSTAPVFSDFRYEYIALKDAKTAHEEAIEKLNRQIQGEKEREIVDLEERWKKENGKLMGSMSNQLMELELARVELKRLEAELAMKDKGLGSAGSSLERLKEELNTVRRDLANTRREQQRNMQENGKLSVCVDNNHKVCIHSIDMLCASLFR